MNAARFKQIADIIRDEAAEDQKPAILDFTPDGETLDRIAMLLRKGVTRGIHPQWTFRKSLDATPTRSSLAGIADVIEDGFTSGEFESGEISFGWRIDVYAMPASKDNGETIEPEDEDR